MPSINIHSWKTCEFLCQKVESSNSWHYAAKCVIYCLVVFLQVYWRECIPARCKTDRHTQSSWAHWHRISCLVKTSRYFLSIYQLCLCTAQTRVIYCLNEKENVSGWIFAVTCEHPCCQLSKELLISVNCSWASY